MPGKINYRRSLLAAVEGFLDASPKAVLRARGIVRRCLKSEQHFTLDGIVWGGVTRLLMDAEFYTTQETLLDLREVLRHGSPEIHRGYLNSDFVREFTTLEAEWYAKLSVLAAFLAQFPFERMTDAAELYERQVEEIGTIASQTLVPHDRGSETVYHFILREVTAILTNIDLRISAHVNHLTPTFSYSTFPNRASRPNDRFVDTNESIEWARKALAAISAQGWLPISWQITPTHYMFTLH